MEDNIIMLEDEEGNTIETEVIDVFELVYGGKKNMYFCLCEIVPEGEINDEIIITRVEGEGDNADLVSVDDDEAEAVFKEFLRRDEACEE